MQPIAYPRSFLALLMTAFLLVALPLAAALAYAAWSMERLANQSRQGVSNATQAVRVSRSLAARASAIERVARQLAVQPEAGLLADLARARASLVEAVDELARLPLETEPRALLDRIVADQNALYELLTESDAPVLDAGVVAARAEKFVGATYEMVVSCQQVADRVIAQLSADADAAQRQMIVLVLITAAGALALAIGLTRLVARPIQQLDVAIRRLGNAEFHEPIRVHGPEDLRTLGERLDWLRRRWLELEAQKNRFMRHVSHELKPPLTALREGAELLHDQTAGPLVPSQRQVVSIMRDNSAKLQRLIEELLDYQRVLHAAAVLETQPVALDALLREVAHSHGLSAAAKGLQFALELPPLRLEADREKLRSVFDNLVGNAVKFTPRGGRVTLRLQDLGNDVLVEVVDTGPGVPPEERETIFDTFFRGRVRGSARVESSGLGLAIAREFTEAHRGRIDLVAGGPGGHFRVRLPKRAASLQAEAA